MRSRGKNVEEEKDLEENLGGGGGNAVQRKQNCTSAEKRKHTK